METASIDSLIDTFTAYLAVNKNYSPSTIESYSGTIARLVEWLKVHRKHVSRLQQITADDLQLFLATLKHPKEIQTQNGLKPHPKAGELYDATTRARIISAIKSFFKWAVKQRHLEFDVSQTIESPKLGERKPKSLTVEDASKMEMVATSRKIPERDRLIIALFLLLGLRVSELVSIDLQHISDYDGSIKILGKGNKERELTLTPKIVRLLDAYKPVRADILLKRKRSTQPALFVSEKRGDRLTTRAVQLIIDQIALEAGVTAAGGAKVTPHKLRHTCATVLYNEGQGADILALAEILGHEDPNTTKIYTSVKKETLRSVIISNPLEQM